MNGLCLKVVIGCVRCSYDEVVLGEGEEIFKHGRSRCRVEYWVNNVVTKMFNRHLN